MSKMKIDAHEIEFDDDLMNLFKTNNDGFQKTIETLVKVMAEIDKDKEISLHKVNSDKEISLHKVDCDKEISFHQIESDERMKKTAKCHSTFDKIVDSTMTFLSDFDKDYDSSTEYLDNRSDDEVEKDINKNYKFVDESCK